MNRSRSAILLGVVLCGVCARDGLAQDKTVSEWLTTADRTSLFAEQPSHPGLVRSGPASGETITIDRAQRFQQMQGFGYALTGGSAELLMKMSEPARAKLLRELFGTAANDIGVSYLRVSVGASDMNSKVFTYDDMPAGETDPALAHFSLGPDLDDVVPVLKEILAINPRITLLASPWSAPSWMKDNDKPKGGSLKPEFYPTYAHYFVRYVQAIAAQGIHIDALTIQNEPLNANNTPSMIMTAQQQDNFLGDSLGPALRTAGLKTDVILYDHNCDRPDYPLDILADAKAAQYAQGSGFHLYGGSIDAMSKVHDAYPAKDLYFTEQMTTQERPGVLQIAESTSRLMVGAPRNWSRNVLLWNLAADPHNGPHTNDGGCPVCQGAITLDGDKVTRNLAYYTVAQSSLFVRPGSVRVASTEDAALPNVAYVTPDGRTVLVVANPGTAAHDFRVTEGTRSFTSALAPGAVATYVWK